MGCLKNRFCILHSDTRGGVLHSAHPLHGPRRPPESRPPPPPPHRRFVQRGRHAPGRSSLMWPPFGSAPLTSGQVAEAVSWLHRQAHELLTLAARVRLRCGHCRDLTQSPHVPILTAFLLSQVVLIRQSLSLHTRGGRAPSVASFGSAKMDLSELAESEAPPSFYCPISREL